MQQVVELFAGLLTHLQTKQQDPEQEDSAGDLSGFHKASELQGDAADGDTSPESISADFLPKRSQDRNWSESWKLAVKGVLQKQRRERIRDKGLQKVQAYTRRIIPKSEGTREHLRKILSASFLFGDLEPSLREEIVDAFEDIRVLSGQNIIKQGDPADNFYVIVSLERTLGNLTFLSGRGEKHPCL
ncbi:cAMP-dependent protein kinase type II-beta regulatory subunit-like [Selaginella moellendorffii]|uniref:cAMP-dependent protein kinase type II-beta regulatory subunit-like n=1 Tax=Selaginella moellendorffii TaxID=88036 RepID=UPI000D1CDC87|nr:cAMP-dependent protein kinase type II-beta regulatory subunit-like [Selaginella moellendorffii]|eukprot:XP_024516338.1 cAMP-dependent protein kinase type II-beta regulatory subunit-like [Selaginella moellendorffii]